MLLSVLEARNRLLKAFAPLNTEFVPLQKARGRILGATVKAIRDYPPFTNSSMDGFAVLARDLAGATMNEPVVLSVVADIPAGLAPSISIHPGEAARIMTGAPLPDGADAVIPVEATDFNVREAGTKAPESVSILRALKQGDYVRHKGEDIRAGETLLEPGRRLAPKDIGLLAMLGMPSIEVFRRPQVAVLPSGDELLSPGEPSAPGKIFESNGFTLCGLIEQAGGFGFHLGIVPDNARAVQNRLDEAVAMNVDLILSSAGVSVGAFDYVRNVVETQGDLDFWKVNMRPGKPLVFGHYRNIPFIGLPGNPVSSYIGFEVFVRFALYKMLGIPEWKPEKIKGRLLENIESDGRESYLRGVLRRNNGDYEVSLTGHQGSGNHYSLVQANSLVIVPAGVKFLPAGADVDIWLLKNE